MVFLLLSLFTEGMPTPIYGVSSTAPNHNGGAFSLKQGGEGQGQQAPRFQQFYLLYCHLKATKNIHTHIYVCMCIYSEAIKHFSLMELILKSTFQWQNNDDTLIPPHSKCDKMTK